MYENYSTTMYVYQQITRVLLVDTSGGYFALRYSPVYAKSLTINKGVDNVLLFEFINQDQKPVNILGSTFTFRLIDQEGTSLLLEKPMQILSASTGRAKVVLNASDTVGIQAQPASYAVVRAAGNYTQAVYVNANSQARGDANVVDSVAPEPLCSRSLTIPDIYAVQAPLKQYPGSPSSNNLSIPNMTATYYSSEVISPNYMTTFQLHLDCYTGTIKFEGKLDQYPDWQNASYAYEYQAESGWKVYSVTGNYDRLRIAFDNRLGMAATANITVSTEGVVTGISVSNPGQDYPAPPRVVIIGNGTGARAVSSVSGGAVGGITVLDGGEGYTPLQIGNSVRAYVQLDGGAVTEILYR